MSDEKPITNEDLYGKSESAPTSTPQVAPDVQSVPSSLPIEETPEITMDQTTPPPHEDAPMLAEPKKMAPPPAEKKKKSGCLNVIGTIIVFIGLFAIGIWLSSFVRQFLQPVKTTQSNQEAALLNNSPTPTTIGRAPTPASTYALWKTYDVMSGITKKPVPGVQYKLPPEVLAPICDGSGCSSQGTYLPGGTRLTIAPRGTGQVLRDFRGTVISDVNGTPFATKKITVAGMPATEYSGGFGGRTISGYAFNNMRGVMIELTESMSLELNHFTPSGITSDFEKDDLLFDDILKNIMITGFGTKGAVIPTPTKVATSSGY